MTAKKLCAKSYITVGGFLKLSAKSYIIVGDSIQLKDMNMTFYLSLFPAISVSRDVLGHL